MSFAEYDIDWSQFEAIAQCPQLTGLTILGSADFVLSSNTVLASLPLLRLKQDFFLTKVFPTTLMRLEITRARDIDLRSLTGLLFLDVKESRNVVAPLLLQGLVIDSHSSISNVKDLHLEQVLVWVVIAHRSTSF